MNARRPDEIDRGRQIREIRLRLGETYDQFSARFGLTKASIVGWEKGSPPHIDHLPLLLQLGLRVSGLEAPGSRQLLLPFDQTFALEMRIGPRRAGSVDLTVEIKEAVI